MKKTIFLLIFLYSALAAVAQPTNKVYWVGPENGGTLNSSNWAVTSGGAVGAYPSNVDYQLIFDGGGTAGKTYTVDVNTTTGGYIVVANNTTVILQRNANNSSVMVANSGYSVQAGSKLVLENTGTGSLYFTIFGNAPSYNSNVAGEMVIKSPVINCTQSSCSEVWLNLSGLIMPFGTKVLSVSGTLRLDGTRAMIHVSNPNSLVFAAGANFTLNADLQDIYDFVFNLASTVTLSGRARLSTTYPNTVYDCSAQTDTRSFAGTVSGNMTIKNTGTGLLTVSGSLAKNFTLQGSPNVQVGNYTVNGNVNIQSGQELDVNGDFNVKGNFDNQGTVKATATGTTNSAVRFTGTVQQTFTPGTVNNDALSFEVNNPAGIAVSGNWSLSSNTNAKLTLTTGNIQMGANTLTVQNPLPGAVVGGTSSSHVIGKLRRTTNTLGSAYLFPVSASATESANVKLSPTSSASTSYEVSFSRPSPYSQTAVPVGVRNAANYYWDVSRVSGTADANLTLVYGANNFAAQNPNPQSDLRVLHWNGASWDNLGGSGANGEITVNNVSAFSPFTLGTVGVYALPVRLVSFVGIRQGNGNLLTWKVAEEKDVRFYEVERSANGQNFTSLGKVAAGNSSGSADYSYTDLTPHPSVNFYRLKMVDKDGRPNYSQTLSVKMSGKEKLAVYPNPASGLVYLQFTSTDGRLLIYDAAGKLVRNISLNQSGVLSTSIDVSNLPKGTYVVKAGGESAVFVKR